MQSGRKFYVFRKTKQLELFFIKVIGFNFKFHILLFFGRLLLHFVSQNQAFQGSGFRLQPLPSLAHARSVQWPANAALTILAVFFIICDCCEVRNQFVPRDFRYNQGCAESLFLRKDTIYDCVKQKPPEKYVRSNLDSAVFRVCNKS